MAVNGNGKNFPFMEFPLSISRQDAFPLERYGIFYSLADAQEYAANSPVAYVGQFLGVVVDGVATAYQIKNEAGELTPLSGGAGTGNVSSDDIDTIVALDLNEYEALNPPADRTVYIILG